MKFIYAPIIPLPNLNYQWSPAKIVSGAAKKEKSHQPLGRPVEIDSGSTEEDKSDLSSKNVKEISLNTLEALDTTLRSEIQSTKKRKYSQKIVIGVYHFKSNIRISSSHSNTSFQFVSRPLLNCNSKSH